MFFRSPPVRNEFVDPPSADQSTVTLLLGDERLSCRLIEVAIGGFTVITPRATVWSGEPIARLVTYASTYKVRIIKQEACYDGFKVVLERVDELAANAPTQTQQWIIRGSRCCAIGLIAAGGYCFLFAPGGVTRGEAHPVTLDGLVSYWFDSWSAPAALVVARSSNDESKLLPTIIVSNEGSGDEPTAISVSSVGREADADIVPDRRSLIQAGLMSANSQRSRPLNSETLPWLFPASDRTRSSVPRCRMSRSAEDDLRMFAAGLQALSPTAAADAVQSLNAAIRSIPTAASARVDGFPTVRSLRSEDAEFFFRLVDGEAEVLRILPVDLPEATPVRSPSASAKRHSVHR